MIRILVACVVLLAAAPRPAAAASARPNILWISVEDLSAGTLGCYGGAARTPRIDGCAAAGLRCDAAFAAAPVCAPSRSAVITGVMPTSLGSLPMRCRAVAPPHVVGLPRLLRAAGYHCTNNAKTDYNFAASFDAGWHASGTTAHWRSRPDPSRPFFAVFNLGATHEGRLFGDAPQRARGSLPPAERADPDSVRVPPYYPDTPRIRECLAWRLDLAAVLDREVGRILDELATDGLADSTIVVIWGDHGEGIPRGKRSLTELGLRVPLIVRVPERFLRSARLPGGAEAHGATDDLVSLLDLAPTMLDLAGVEIPGWIEGRSLLGPHATRRDVVVAAADRMDDVPGYGRSVRDGRFRYVRNFLPWLDGDDLPDYAAGVPITGELRSARAAGTLPEAARWFSRTRRPADELHDVAADPDQLTDLAADADHADELARLRTAAREWMRTTRDTGILPEPILRREARAAGSEWAIFHPGDSAAAAAGDRYDAILAAAWDVAEADGDRRAAGRLESDDAAVRFWAVEAVGWAAVDRGDAAAPATVVTALGDPDPAVRIAAARWTARFDGVPATAALDVLAREAAAGDPDVRLAALVAIDRLGDRGRRLWRTVAAVEVGDDEEYARRTIERIRGRLADAAP